MTPVEALVVDQVSTEPVRMGNHENYNVFANCICGQWLSGIKIDLISSVLHTADSVVPDCDGDGWVGIGWV